MPRLGVPLAWSPVGFDVTTAAVVCGLIFLGELPDKRFIATLVMATRVRPLLVWNGVSLALLVQTAGAGTAGGGGLWGAVAKGMTAGGQTATSAVTAVSTSTLTMTKALSVAAVALLVGAGSGVVAGRATAPGVERVVYLDRPVTIEPHAPSVSPRTATESTVRAEDLPTVAPRSSAAPQVSVARSGDLLLERKLVDEARIAFARGEGDLALAILERHERALPHGQLAEERDALRVRASADMGRRDEAQKLAKRFRGRYPKSLLGPAVAAAVQPDASIP